MPLHVSEMFTRDVTIGFLAMMLGAVLIMLVALGWQLAGGWAPKGHSPLLLPGLCGMAVGLFTAGLIWQLWGYLRLEYTRWWTW